VAFAVWAATLTALATLHICERGKRSSTVTEPNFTRRTFAEHRYRGVACWETIGDASYQVRFSSLGARESYAMAAVSLAQHLAANGIAIVYGGARVGLIGRLADAALEAGGEVIGIMRRSLVEREVAHARLSDLRVVDSLHERKAQMAELSDAFIALPGGYGTFEEFCEVLTSQLGTTRRTPKTMRNSEHRRLLRSPPIAVRSRSERAVFEAGASRNGAFR